MSSIIDTDYIITHLEKNKKIFQSLLSDAIFDLQQWRPQENNWNQHEIVCHLLDEEQFDFRARIQHTLEIPGEPMPSINPVEWVKEKNYAIWNYEHTLENFLEERNKSIFYLRSLKGVDWEIVHHHPALGAVTAESFLYNWLAHDYLHIRQINKNQYLFFKENSGIDLNYAGKW